MKSLPVTCPYPCCIGWTDSQFYRLHLKLFYKQKRVFKKQQQNIQNLPTKWLEISSHAVGNFVLWRFSRCVFYFRIGICLSFLCFRFGIIFQYALPNEILDFLRFHQISLDLGVRLQLARFARRLASRACNSVSCNFQSRSA